MRIYLIISGIILSLCLHAQPDNVDSLNEIFKSQKGKLICPIEDGIVDVGTIYIDGSTKKLVGTDIYGSNSKVICVFDGVVVSPFKKETGDYSIIVSHGDYFTVYNNIATHNLIPGMKIKQGDLIGVTSKKRSGSFLFFMELWKASDKLNPADWLRCGRGALGQ